MPEIGANGGIQRGARLPVIPQQQHTDPAGIGSSVSRLGDVVSRSVQNATYKPPRSGGSDAATSGPGYGSPVANSYKQTPQYHHAIASVFRLQPPRQQALIIHNLAHTPNAPEAIGIGNAWQLLPQPRQLQIVHFLGPKPGLYINALLSHSQNRSLASVPGSFTVNLSTGKRGPYDPAKDYPLSGIGMSTKGGGPLRSLASVQAGVKPSGIGRVLQNAGKDLVNLPAETLATVGTVGGDALSLHPGKAVGDIVNPIVQTVEHPVKSFLNDPLNTLWIGGALVHGGSRAAAAPVRALAPADSALGRAVSTQREGVALTGKLTHERAPFSKSPTVKAQQRAVDNLIYTRAPTGELIPKSEWLRKRQISQEIGQLVGTRERIRAVNRGEVHATHLDAVQPSRLARVAHAAKTSLAYGPKGAAIPGAEVLTLIADTTIRRVDTVERDLQKHLQQVSANRANLLHDPQALKAHDAYVKVLTKALKNKSFLRDPGPAFAAAAKLDKAYAPVEGKAFALGHFGADMTREGLQRRALMHYAASHMGARHDAELGLVVDRTLANGKTEAAPLSTADIVWHLNGPEGTGGRMPMYTSDQVRFDREKAARQANFVSDARRPLPQTKQNTLYAYTHGLTNPSHEALLERHALLQGVVDSHHSQNAYLDSLVTKLPGGKYGTYEEAKRAAPPGYSPINIAQPFHQHAALDAALQGTNPAGIEEEAMRHSLDMNARLQPAEGSMYGIIDNHALKILHDFQNQISPNTLLRSIRGLNNQFRTVALATSAKHIPGVAQENLIRDIAQGVGFRSWVTGHRVLKTMERQAPEQARDTRTQLTGGQVAGMTAAGKTYLVSDHWAGTSVYPFLKAFEAASKAPGPRQLRGVWKWWTKLAIQGTKHALEEQHQIAGLGKAVLREHGYADAARVDGMMGLIHRAFALHGQLLEDAAKGMFDPRKAKQTRAVIQQIYGKWTDLSPAGQTALMFSPFGLWWANSARFLARMPIDQPVKTGLLAGATEGTQNQRQAHGLDMFMKGALPAYMQGGIPVGGKILAQNYYSPFGIANDPLATGQSLIQPWATPIVLGALGVNWLGKPLSSPGNPHGSKPSSLTQHAQYIIDSALSSFLPLYTKAKQIAEGGASAYDVNGKGLSPIPPATKKPGKGPGAGAAKALLPFRQYTIPAGTGSATDSGGWGGGSSSSSGGDWGTGGSPSGSSGGWG